MTSVLRISPAVQNYAWGKVGLKSEVAKLFSSSSGQPVDEAVPYAEVCFPRCMCALCAVLCVFKITCCLNGLGGQ